MRCGNHNLGLPGTVHPSAELDMVLRGSFQASASTSISSPKGRLAARPSFPFQLGLRCPRSVHDRCDDWSRIRGRLWPLLLVAPGAVAGWPSPPLFSGAGCADCLGLRLNMLLLQLETQLVVGVAVAFSPLAGLERCSAQLPWRAARAKAF